MNGCARPLATAVLVVALLVTFLASPQPAAAIDALLLDDAWTDSGSGNANHGDDANLVVTQGAKKSYLLFDFSNFPAGTTGSNVAQATLKLWVNSVTASGTVDVFPVTSTWAEETVTFNSAPSQAG